MYADVNHRDSYPNEFSNVVYEKDTNEIFLHLSMHVMITLTPEEWAYLKEETEKALFGNQ